MILPDDDITIPKPVKGKSHTGLKLLGLFAIIGVIGLGTCGYTMQASNPRDTASVGLTLIGVSLIGIVVSVIVILVEFLSRSKES